jgi:Phosphoesterase family
MLTAVLVVGSLVWATPARAVSIGVAQSFGAADAATATALSASTNVATGAGDLLVAAVKVRDPTALAKVMSITDSAKNSWVRAISVIQGLHADAEIWYSTAASSVSSLTVAVNGAAALAMTVLDVTGTISNPQDRTTALSGNNATASTGATSATTQANEIVIAAIGWNTKVTPSAQTAGYNTTATEQSTASGNATGEQAAWRVVNTIGTQMYGATLSSAVSWTGTLVTFKAGTVTPPPEITGFTPTMGPDRATVMITGTGFTYTTVLGFNGTGQASFTVSGDTQITTTVPAGATSGTLTVTTPGGTATSPSSFTVQPAIGGFSPTSAPIGSVVTIVGSGFTAVSNVAFNGSTATVMSATDSQIVATVPAAASNGPLTVTTPGGTATSSASFTVTTSPTTPHVMVVVLENRGYKATLGTCTNDPYYCSLASAYASDTSWHAISHPSLPNYLALDSGSMQGCTSDSCTGPYTAPELGGQLTGAGIPWAAYMEAMPSACYTQGSGGRVYVKRHNPFVYFNDVLTNGCTNVVLPYPGISAFVSALTNPGAPDFVWITPDLNDDMTTGTILQGDEWLQANIGPVLSSAWFTAGNATVIITMDEGLYADATNQIPMVVISSNAQGKGNLSSPNGDHYGLLRSIEETYGLITLGAAADPTNGDLTGLFG